MRRDGKYGYDPMRIKAIFINNWLSNVSRRSINETCIWCNTFVFINGVDGIVIVGTADKYV